LMDLSTFSKFEVSGHDAHSPIGFLLSLPHDRIAYPRRRI